VQTLGYSRKKGRPISNSFHCAPLLSVNEFRSTRLRGTMLLPPSRLAEGLMAGFERFSARYVGRPASRHYGCDGVNNGSRFSWGNVDDGRQVEHEMKVEERKKSNRVTSSRAYHSPRQSGLRRLSSGDSAAGKAKRTSRAPTSRNQQDFNAISHNAVPLTLPCGPRYHQHTHHTPCRLSTLHSPTMLRPVFRQLSSAAVRSSVAPRTLAPVSAVSQQQTRNAHAISNPTLANIEKRWETMPPQEQADLWMALRDRMKVDWNELTVQEKKAGMYTYTPIHRGYEDVSRVVWHGVTVGS